MLAFHMYIYLSLSLCLGISVTVVVATLPQYSVSRLFGIKYFANIRATFKLNRRAPVLGPGLHVTLLLCGGPLIGILWALCCGTVKPLFVMPESYIGTGSSAGCSGSDPGSC